jgi:hypothetical protein
MATQTRSGKPRSSSQHFDIAAQYREILRTRRRGERLDATDIEGFIADVQERVPFPLLIDSDELNIRSATWSDSSQGQLDQKTELVGTVEAVRQDMRELADHILQLYAIPALHPLRQQMLEGILKSVGFQLDREIRRFVGNIERAVETHDKVITKARNRFKRERRRFSSTIEDPQVMMREIFGTCDVGAIFAMTASEVEAKRLWNNAMRREEREDIVMYLAVQFDELVKIYREHVGEADEAGKPVSLDGPNIKQLAAATFGVGFQYMHRQEEDELEQEDYASDTQERRADAELGDARTDDSEVPY